MGQQGRMLGELLCVLGEEMQPLWWAPPSHGGIGQKMWLERVPGGHPEW